MFGLDKLWDWFGDSGDSLKGIVQGGTIVSGVGYGAIWLFIFFKPIDHWITYHSMYVAGDQIVGEGFTVKSFASFKRSVDITYNDVLQCKDKESGTFINYSSQPFEIDNHYPPATETPISTSMFDTADDVYVSPWRYSAKTPDYPATCRIRGTQRVKMWLGIDDKESVVTTNEFKFVHN